MSSTSRALDCSRGGNRSGGGRQFRGAAVACVGILWGNLALAIGVIVLPGYLAYGLAVRSGLAYRIVAYTALLPWTLADACRTWTAKSISFGGAGFELDSVFAVALLAPLVACALAYAVLRVCRARGVMLALVPLAVAAVLAGVVLVGQLADGVRAEREFFALISTTEVPHRSPMVVEGTRAFLVEHPYSRWRSEALRITAMAAEESSDYATAERTWHRFGESFHEQGVPGMAYAEYSSARCWERLGWPHEAARHYRAAVGVIRARNDGIQSWIGSDGAKAIARLARADGLVLRARYWTERADDVSALRRD